jgi:hypothetical protein
MWNLALDVTGSPKLPRTKNCRAPGCRGIVQINSDGTYIVNQECELRSKASLKLCQPTLQSMLWPRLPRLLSHLILVVPVRSRLE